MSEKIEPSESENETSQRKDIKGYIVSNVILVLSVVICLIITVITLAKGYVSICGFSMFRVVTGSMEPTVPVGAAVLCRSESIDNIELNDIVCFRSRESDHYGVIVTHRVVAIQNDENGEIMLETRGDANFVSDSYYVNETNLIGIVIWYSGKESVITNMLSFVTGKTGFFACIVFPVLLVAGLALRSAVKNLRRDINLALDELSKIESGAENDLLPGYQTLTVSDYNDIYNTLKQELLEELNQRAEETDSTIE